MYKNVVHETKGLISVAIGKEDEYTEASLAVSKSLITLSEDLKNEIREAIANEQPYGEIMQQIEEEQLNQLERDDGVYKIKHGVLKIHSPILDGLFWKIIVPNNKEVKRKLLDELHSVPYVGHRG